MGAGRIWYGAGALIGLCALAPTSAWGLPFTVGGVDFEDARQFAVTATVVGIIRDAYRPEVKRRLATHELSGWVGEPSHSLKEAVCGPDVTRGLYLGVPRFGVWPEADPFIDRRKECIFQRLELGFDPEFGPIEGAGPDLVLFDAARTDRPEVLWPNGLMMYLGAQAKLADGRWTPLRMIDSRGGHLIEPPVMLAGRVRDQIEHRDAIARLRFIPYDLRDFGVPVGEHIQALRLWYSHYYFYTAPAEVQSMTDGEVSHGIMAVAGMSKTCDVDADCPAPDPCTGVRCEARRCRYFTAEPGTPCEEGGYCNGAPRPSCVPCTEDAHCRPPTPVCDISPVSTDTSTSTAACVVCLKDADCPSPSAICRQPSCQEKECGAQVAPRGTPCEGGYCDGAADPSCVACTEDAHCEGGQRCAPEGVCVACLEDADCAVDDACVSQALCVRRTCAYDRIPGCGEPDNPAPKKDPPKPAEPQPEKPQAKLLRDGGCRCTHPSAAGAWPALLALGLLLGRRRRG